MTQARDYMGRVTTDIVEISKKRFCNRFLFCIKYREESKGKLKTRVVGGCTSVRLGEKPNKRRESRSGGLDEV